MYSFILDKKVEKFLDKQNDKFVLNFFQKVEILLKNPYSRENNLDIRPLTGKPKNHFRLRISKYRFI